MQVHVVQQFLIPGVQHGGEAELPFQAVLRVTRKFVQVFGHAVKQQRIQDLLVGRQQIVEFVWQREDGVEIADGQQFGLPVGQPRGLGLGLALRAMAVAARIIHQSPVPAVVALLDMAAQGGRAADFDGVHDPELHPRQDMAVAVGGAMQTENSGHLPGRSGVRRRRRRGWLQEG
jgi:hypothetical protein